MDEAAKNFLVREVQELLAARRSSRSKLTSFGIDGFGAMSPSPCLPAATLPGEYSQLGAD